MTFASEVTLSRRIAVYVNLTKLFQLAALTPPVVTGIAKRASAIENASPGGLGAGIDTAALVAATATIGSLCGIVGALGLGALSDAKWGPRSSRWPWVIAGSAVGSLGLLLLVFGSSPASLLAGWGIAQLGYSGSMAVLRTILGTALETQRRRGAIFAVLGGYAGIFIALAILLLVPNRVWETTFGLAALSGVVPLIFLWSIRGRISPRRTSRASRASRAEQTNAKNLAPATNVREAVPAISPALLLTIQCASGAVMSAFLSYHPLDLAERLDAGSALPVRATVWVLVAAILGLLLTTMVLIRKPHLMGHSRRALVFAGLALTVSLILRAVCDPLPFIMVAAGLSGIAVGVNSSVLLSTALEIAPRGRNGSYIGAYSAAGVVGQLIGPLLGLAILSLAAKLQWTGEADPSFRIMFLILALLPAAWTTAILMRRKR